MKFNLKVAALLLALVISVAAAPIFDRWIYANSPNLMPPIWYFVLSAKEVLIFLTGVALALISVKAGLLE